MRPALCPYSSFPPSESLDLAEPTRMAMIFICSTPLLRGVQSFVRALCKVRGRNENTPVHARGQAGPSEPHPLRTPPPVCHASPFSSAPTRDLLLSSPWPALCSPVRFGVPGSLCRAQRADHTQALAFLPAQPALLLSTLCLAPSTLASLDRRQAETAALSALTSGPVAYVGYTASCTTSCAAMTSAANVRPLYSTQSTTLTRR